MQLFICLNVQRNEKDHALTYLWHQKTCTYSLQIFYEIQKNLKEKQKKKKERKKKKKKRQTLIFDIKMYVHVL